MLMFSLLRKVFLMFDSSSHLGLHLFLLEMTKEAY